MKHDNHNYEIYIIPLYTNITILYHVKTYYGLSNTRDECR